MGGVGELRLLAYSMDSNKLTRSANYIGMSVITPNESYRHTVN